jgi:EXPERA (EXPanded EBP superfamily)
VERPFARRDVRRHLRRGRLDSRCYTTPHMESSPQLRRVVILWSLISGIVHFTWELSWCIVSSRLARPEALHGWWRIWSIYGIADRRYLNADSFILILEVITATVGGALNFYVVVQAWRGRLQAATVALLIVSVMEVYGTLMYLGSEVFTRFANVHTASFVDAWLKFFAVNMLWVVFPGVFIFESARFLVAGGASPFLRATALQPLTAAFESPSRVLESEV